MAKCGGCGAESSGSAPFCAQCGQRLERVNPYRRKLATMLFCDVVGSTALGERLDIETLREVMLGYFAEMRAAIESNGGTPEKFIGDAVLAVFGVPVVHEDDAVRAVTAALEMQAGVERLNEQLSTQLGVQLAIRIGVYSGVVVAGDAVQEESLVLGDPVNVAARLEQAAGPGEVLIGEPTYRLVRHAVRAEPVEPISAKGKSEPLVAYRLLSVEPRGRARRSVSGSPFIGRSSELGSLERLIEEVVKSKACRLHLVVGEAGIGKSRLVAQFEAALDATVLRGRALPYGDGNSNWPLGEVLKQGAGVLAEDSPAEALRRIAGLMGGGPAAERVALTLGRAIGLAAGAESAEGISWATRQAFETLATDRPLVVVLDDLQWAEDSFLDLIEHVALTSSGAPILLLGIGRPELLGRRASWPLLRLDPLGEEDATTLVHLLGEFSQPGANRLVARAAGNPLFLEEIVAAVTEQPELSVPLTLEGLLAARIDRLERWERPVVEVGAVEGEVFHRPAIEHLSDDLDATEIARALDSLLGAELIRREEEIADEDEIFRFRSLLLRDAAYESIPKRLRAELHERFANWVITYTGVRVAEYEEIIGYHLEQSYRYRAELGIVDAAAQVLAGRAVDWLSSAGRRAFALSDAGAATRLLRRAAALAGAEPVRQVEILIDLATAHRDGGEREAAEEALGRAAAMAAELGEERLVLSCEVEQAFLQLWVDPDADLEKARRTADRAIEMFGPSGSPGDLVRPWMLRGEIAWFQCRGQDMEDAFLSALDAARSAGDSRREAAIVRKLALAYVYGPTVAAVAIERCADLLVLADAHNVELAMRISLASLEAIRGHLETARESMQRCRELAEELGLRVMLASLANYISPLEAVGGDPATAARDLRRSCESLAALGETAVLSTSAGYLARTLERIGDLEEAQRYTVLSEQNALAEDLASQILWRGTRARVLARRGQLAEALEMAREATDLADRTDFPMLLGDALMDLAEVERAAGDTSGALAAATRALEVFDAKGHTMLASGARELIAELSL